MIWAVLDTNVLVSGLGWRGTAPGRTVELAREGRFILVTSEALLDELERVLAYPRLASLFPDPPRIAALIGEIAVIVRPDRTVEAIAEDPADNRVLEAAIAAQAELIVSGDRHLLALKAFEEVEITTPGAFLARLGAR